MSSRLFEAMAAGAVVIGDEHPFIPAAIGENFIRVPSHLPAEERARQICAALQRLGDHPDEAVAMATASQRALLDSYHMCSQLASVYEAAHQFTERSRSLTLPTAQPVVDIVVQPMFGEAAVVRDRINRLATSCRGRARVTVLVEQKQQDWFERNVDKTVQIVPLSGPQDRMLGPAECLEVAGPRLACPRVAFLLGIEEIFAETFVAACMEAAGHPVARLGHVLRHRDAQGNVHCDYFHGAGDVNGLHDSAVGCVIFDREWLTKRVPIEGISWKDICRMAIFERQSVVDCPSTALVIDISEYEQLLHRIAPPHAVPLDIATLSRLSGSVQETISSSAVVVACRPAAVAMQASRGLTAENLLETVHGMDQEKRWRLGLDLYHAIPMPGWTRSFLTFARKRLGIR
jgi:hypothetical protein